MVRGVPRREPVVALSRANRRAAAVFQTVVLLAFLAAGCSHMPVTIDPVAWPRQESLNLHVGEAFTIKGFLPAAIQVMDDGILELQAASDDTLATTAQATYAAVAVGQTELVVTQGMCQAITANCGEPALYYTVQVRVR